MTAATIEPSSSSEVDIGVEVSVVKNDPSLNRWTMPLDTRSEDAGPSEDVLQVDVDKNVTKLYEAITACKWDDAVAAVKADPKEARTWVIRYSHNDGDDDSLDSEKAPEIMWRFLPIHSACARQPPLSLITELLRAHPEGAKSIDDQGMHSLHYACGNQASREVIRALLYAHPEAASLTDPQGMLPIHYLACWGPSSVSVIDMVLVAHRNVAFAKDSEGKTPLDLALAGDYPDSKAVAEAIKRWIGDTSKMTEEVKEDFKEEDVVEKELVKVEEEAAPKKEALPVDPSPLAPVAFIGTVDDAVPPPTAITPLELNDIDDVSLGATSAKALGPVVPGDMDDGLARSGRRRGVRRHRGLRQSKELEETPVVAPRIRSMDAGTGPDDGQLVSREMTVGVFERPTRRELEREQHDLPLYQEPPVQIESVVVDDAFFNERSHRTIDRVMYCPLTPKPSKNVSCGTMTIEHMSSPRTVGMLHDEIDQLIEDAEEAEDMWESRLADMEDNFHMQIEELEARLKQAAEENKERSRRIAELESKVETCKSELASNAETMGGMAKDIKELEEERDDLRQTLADLSSSHDQFKGRAQELDEHLGSVNNSVTNLITEQGTAFEALAARERKAVESTDERRSQLEALMRLEDESGSLMPQYTMEAKDFLSKQMEEMAAMTTEIAALLDEE